MNRARDLVLSSCVSLAALTLTACVGTTGGDLVTFNAAAAGPADAVAGQRSYALPHPTGRGYEVTLTLATLHVGAVYLNTAIPISGAQDTDCILPGRYVAQVTQGFDVDVLDPTPQPFPIAGDGVAVEAVAGEVWLMHGDVNATGDTLPILQLAGTAVGSGGTYPFAASLTIDENRRIPVTDPALPSQHPICKERIVSPIVLDNGVTRDITPKSGGSLLLRVDPSGWFDNVDFSRLTQTSTSPPLYTFADASTDQPSTNLYSGIQARGGVYDFFWIDSPNP